MEWIVLPIVALAGIGLGYTLCLAATWVRIHRQESELRHLINDLVVMRELREPAPPEWVLEQLQTMLHREFG